MVLLAASIVAHPSHCVRSLSASDIILLNVKETGVGTAIRTCREKSEVSSSIVVSDGLNGYKNRFRPSHLNQASHLFAPLKTSSHILSLIVIYFRMIQKWKRLEPGGTFENIISTSTPPTCYRTYQSAENKILSEFEVHTLISFSKVTDRK